MTGNNSFKIFCRASVVSLLAAISVPTMAATNGSLSTTSSTGSLMVYVTVGAQVLISGLQDYSNPSWDGQPYTFETAPFCVYSTSQNSLYTITASGTSAQNATQFLLSNPADLAHPVSYSVQIDDGTNGAQSLNSGAPLQNVHGSPNANCAGNPNTRLKIQVNHATGSSGTYSGTVNLLVQAQ